MGRVVLNLFATVWPTTRLLKLMTHQRKWACSVWSQTRVTFRVVESHSIETAELDNKAVCGGSETRSEAGSEAGLGPMALTARIR